MAFPGRFNFVKIGGLKWDYQKEGIRKQGARKGALITSCQNHLLQNVLTAEKLSCRIMSAQHAVIIKVGRL